MMLMSLYVLQTRKKCVCVCFLISEVVIIKKGEIVEARLQEEVLIMPKKRAAQVLFKTRIQDIQEI